MMKVHLTLSNLTLNWCQDFHYLYTYKHLNSFEDYYYKLGIHDMYDKGFIKYTEAPLMKPFLVKYVFTLLKLIEFIFDEPFLFSKIPIK